MSIPVQIFRRATLALSGFACAAALTGQTPTPTPSPTPTPIPNTVTVDTYSTENDHAVTGVNIQEQPDGTVWFLIPSNDRIVQLQTDGVTFKQWQIRPDDQIGANPVQFEIDGNFIWFIENGESQIAAGYSAIGRLDTTTGAIREYVIPGAKPAGFYRTPDGNTLWVAQSSGEFQAIDLNTLAVTSYRSTLSFAYSDMIVDKDGSFWYLDFGDNRIVNWMPGAATETSYTISDPNAGRTNLTQLRFNGDSSQIWICEFTGQVIDFFDPASTIIAFYPGFVDPIHFDQFDGNLYVTEAATDNGRVVTFDPRIGVSSGASFLAPFLAEVRSIPSNAPAAIRDSTAVVSTFTSTKTTVAASDVALTNPLIGLLRIQFPSTNGYGVNATGRGIWVGSATKLVHIVPQTLGSATDLIVPRAAQLGNPPTESVNVETTLVNRGAATVSGDILYLYSAGQFPTSTPFSVAPGQTLVIPDTFPFTSTNGGLVFGPARIRISSGAGGDLVGSVRSRLLLPDGSTYGFSVPVLGPAEIPAQGAQFDLFLGYRAADHSAFGAYSPFGGSAEATLYGADGTVRGTRLFQFGVNGTEAFNPAASAFGTTAEPGDVVRVEITSGSIEFYSELLDDVGRDIATCLPVASGAQGVFPNLSNFAAPGGRLSDIFLSNPDTGRAVTVTFSFVGDDGSAPRFATILVPAGGTQTIEDALTNFFGVLQGGAVAFAADGPVAVAARVATRRDSGDYATFFSALSPSQAIPGGATAEAVGAQQTSTRQTDLLLFNDGAAGSLIVIGIDGSGNETGRQTVALGANQTLRIPAVLTQVGGTGSTAARVRVQTAAGMHVYAAAEQIDLGTGDLEITRLR